jgi:NADH-quinone oxidoreductase subunit L
MSGPYNLLLHKYWVDEFYGAVIVKPILATSRFLLEWVVDVAILGGTAWLLGGIATLGGAILQRWQSGNVRSYAAWLAAAAALLLLYVLWAYSPAGLSAFFNHGAGH